MSKQISDLAIIGGGFAGTVTAIKLLRAIRADADGNAAPVSIRIIESRAELGRGIAYSTDNDDHIVNGPAQLFGLYPDRPSHLADWLAANAARHGWTPPAGASFAEAFPPRRLYGSYVQQELQQALRDAGALASLEFVQARALDLNVAAHGYDITLDNGRQLAAARVVLAPGLFRAGSGFFSSQAERRELGERYIDDVWNAHAWRDVGGDEDILLIGSSLTALDAAFNAERAGFKGQFHALSRRGLLVQPRRQLAPWPDVLDAERLPESLSELLRATRIARRAVKAAGADWQQLPPAIRPHVPTLWNKACNADRQRFLRHIRPFWEIALHRAGPESGKKLDQLNASGRLRQLTGRIRALRPAGDKVAVRWTPRGDTADQTLLVDRVVNAAGYEFDWLRVDDTLVRALLTRKLVRPHATGFGIDADPTTGEVLGAAVAVPGTLFAVGHPLRGAAWESNSIPEQVAGAANTALALAASLQTADLA
ncbi:FAD/NAD(P)-binding protein [Herbaspirillum sp. LeCh32-8]|uniref:FAD/NAD(P)-binding protein n=1 Tax=Herbaspirillum sp. LeCh32-8 TaxID=2821356 RepID=UPI001AE55A74|nr:FAD/NAD(P)-binding protein [Herbaspirillum sp. LeCh32-8]MBP0597360.1 FAD/NAD(P)-binding protein [Herbaspirillum sp. LeCh32-8]